MNRQWAAFLLIAALCPAAAAAQSGLPVLGIQIKETPAPTHEPQAAQTPMQETETQVLPEMTPDEALNAYTQAITAEEIASAGLGERILMRGMEGDDVALMQRRLYQLGYYLGDLDGVFGLGTRTAVYGFQRAHKLEKIDGKVGPETIARMFSESAIVKPTPTPSPTPTPTPSPTPTPTPKPTPAPSATPKAEGAPFELKDAQAYIDARAAQLTLGVDEAGELLYPLTGVLEWMGYESAYAAGSWQFVHREDGTEIALMTDGQDGFCEGAMGSYAGTIFLSDSVSRVYVYGEEVYVTQSLLQLFDLDVLVVEGVPVISRSF